MNLDELRQQQKVWERRLSVGRGAYDSDSHTGRAAGVIAVLGPIKHWWDENWMTPEHVAYENWRTIAEDALVEAGYLVYRPHGAFRGTWDERGQSANDFVIQSLADAVVVLTPPGVPSVGTDHEVGVATRFGVPIVEAHPANYYDEGWTDVRRFSHAVRSMLETLEEVVARA